MLTLVGYRAVSLGWLQEQDVLLWHADGLVQSSYSINELFSIKSLTELFHLDEERAQDFQEVCREW